VCFEQGLSCTDICPCQAGGLNTVRCTGMKLLSEAFKSVKKTTAEKTKKNTNLPIGL
jgi:hypothetical protein